jgi:hypothetical protein
MSEEQWFGSRRWQPIFLLLSKASKTGSGAHPAIYTLGIGGTLPWVKRLGGWSRSLIPIYCQGWEVMPLFYRFKHSVVHSNNCFFSDIYLLILSVTVCLFLCPFVPRIRNSGPFDFWINSYKHLWRLPEHCRCSVARYLPTQGQTMQTCNRAHEYKPLKSVHVVQESNTDRRLYYNGSPTDYEVVGWIQMA